MVSGLLLIAMMLIPNDMKPISDGTSRTVTLSRNAASCCEIEEPEEEVEEIIATETDATPTDATPSDATETDATETDAEPEPEIEILECYQEEVTTEAYVEEYVEPEEEAPEEEWAEDVGEPTGLSYYGGFELTAYIDTGCPCADGAYPQAGYTVASNDPNLWHRWIYIDGYGTYYVHDTGGMSASCLDIFMGSYDEAIQFGRQYGEVYLVE